MTSVVALTVPESLLQVQNVAAYVSPATKRPTVQFDAAIDVDLTNDWRLESFIVLHKWFLYEIVTMHRWDSSFTEVKLWWIVISSNLQTKAFIVVSCCFLSV